MKKELLFSEKLLEVLEKNNWYVLPNYQFVFSLDEMIASIYWVDNKKEINKNLSNELEKYCKWCLENLEIIEQINSIE